MNALGVDFQVVPPDINEDEARKDFGEPEGLVRNLALAKAKTVAVDHPNAYILGADTTVCLSGIIFSKPYDDQNAKDMLIALRGKPHRVVTGLALLMPDGETSFVSHTSTTVLMRTYSEEEIDQYISTQSSLDKSGAYGIQDVDFHPGMPVNGCYFNVVGLPLCAAYELLRQAAIIPTVDLNVAKACISHRCPFAGLGKA